MKKSVKNEQMYMLFDVRGKKIRDSSRSTIMHLNKTMQHNSCLFLLYGPPLSQPCSDLT